MMKRLTSLNKYTAHTTTILFGLGFIFDMVMLPDIDHLFTRYVGALYLCIIAFLIIFREWLVSRNEATLFEQKAYSAATFGISYFSGSALSFIFVYALRSAAFSVSWPLLLLFVLCILFNEFVSTHDFRFSLDIGIFLTALLFFIIFNVPLILKKENDTIFLISLGVTLCISFVYLYFLQFSSESAKHEIGRAYALAVGIPMFVCMLYFLNVIPAVPLSLKDVGVYHTIIKKNNGDFVAEGETDTRFFHRYRKSLYHTKLDPNDSVYFFSNIDTSAQLTAPISHVWEYYDEKTKKWVMSSEISFDIQGGRDSGYRAFSYKENIHEGLWRVTVKVGKNRIIGQEKFLIIQTDITISLKQVFL